MAAVSIISFRVKSALVFASLWIYVSDACFAAPAVDVPTGTSTSAPPPSPPPTTTKYVAPVMKHGKTLIANSATHPDLASPADVKFHTAAQNQLWIANRGKNQMLVIHDPDRPQTTPTRSHVWQDRAEYHYNGRVSALAFDNVGNTMISCQNSKNAYNGKLTPNFFMGPTIYEMFPVGELYGRPDNPVASITADGKACTKGGFPDCYLIHSDMLHESPMCMGTVHDPGAVTKGGFHQGELRSGHVYFYSDGLHGELMRFDAESLHGPGSLDHRTANIRRYVDVKLKPVEDVPGHMVLDNTTRILYVADPGNSRVLRVHADGGEFKRIAQCVPDECYPQHEGYVNGTCANTYCTGGRCLDQSDGYGCYHVFTELADIFEYELWGCSTQDDFVTNVAMPSGLAMYNGRLYVGDFSTGIVHIYDMSGHELANMQVSEKGLAGLELKCVNSTTCNLYFANSMTNEIGMATIANEKSDAPSKPLPIQACNIKGNFSRPQFNVTHGAGYQNPMRIYYSYGKHCPGFEPGQTVEWEGFSPVEVFNCPDRADCSAVNGDAILMAGYLCHPCIPNPCEYKSEVCVDSLPYSCSSGFKCVANFDEQVKAKQEYYCTKPTSPVQTITDPVVVADTSSAPGLLSPMDVKFHPLDASQLWVANRGRDQMLVLREPGTADVSSLVWQDRAEYHYNARVTALGFDYALGMTMVTCQNAKNVYGGQHSPNFFMGPTIYETYPVGKFYGRPGNPVASITAEGQACEKPGFPDCYLIHSDMLHESPMCMGTVHDPGAITEGGFHVGKLISGHVYFYSDGLRGTLMRFDAESLHGPGSLDHRTANIRRYLDIKLKAVEDVPGHMVIDKSARILYVADPGNSRVIRVDPDGGEFKRVAQCVPDECYPQHESYVEGTCSNTYCTGGRCLDADGYGCHHVFTETADIFEYEFWGCSTQDDFVKSLQLPSGLALGNGYLYVSDYATGRIHIFDLSGKEVGHLPVSEPGLAGLDLKCLPDSSTCDLFFANSLTNQVGMVSVNNVKSDVAPKPLPRKVCNTTGNFTRPPFNVTHGAGYQNPMVIKYSYGKHCSGFEPGADVEKNGSLTKLQVFACPDRTDCESVNGDAILMAGFLCHPCIPNPCKYALRTCLDLYKYTCTPGFECPSEIDKARNRTLCGSTTTRITTTTTSTTPLLREGHSDGSSSGSFSGPAAIYQILILIAIELSRSEWF